METLEALLLWMAAENCAPVDELAASSPPTLACGKSVVMSTWRVRRKVVVVTASGGRWLVVRKVAVDGSEWQWSSWQVTRGERMIDG